MAEPAPAQKPVKKTHLLVKVEKAGRTVRTAAVKSGAVRVGPAVGIELPYPAAGLDTWEWLFKPRSRAGARLIVRPGMTGEVMSGSSRLKFEDLEGWGLLKGRGKERYLEVTRDMKGWFDYRGLRFFFAWGAEPAQVAEAEPDKRKFGKVPLRFRRKGLYREDVPFALLSFILYGLVALLMLHFSDYEIKEEQTPQVAERFARLVYTAPQAKTRIKKEILEERKKQQEEEAAAAQEVVEEVVEAEPEAQEEAPEQPAEEVAEAPAEEVAEAPAQPQISETERREAIRKEVANKGLLKLIGGKGSAATVGRSGSILQGGGKAADLDRVLSQGGGVRVAGAGEDWSGKELDTEGFAEGSKVAGAGQRTVELAARQDSEVISEEVDEDPAELSRSEIRAKIARAVDYNKGKLAYLYNSELKDNPDLEGKIVVAITIAPDGSVVDAVVVETTMNWPKLENAIIARIKRWQFPPVSEVEQTVTYPFLFVPPV